jgi:hypothetical protein
MLEPKHIQGKLILVYAIYINVKIVDLLKRNNHLLFVQLETDLKNQFIVLLMQKIFMTAFLEETEQAQHEGISI